ncbi:2-hydroxychromene-2-carboxylate isomerase [Wenxinia saemankumensis]|uniref:2-hydroxychromene-2-carboxylate isomerase n=1 Tax=Wenxinia saemankumensis TaxID=1447782 RepID=A0A1M6BV25_9RHOB|nr:2-hydroxychromene-2-carboxylate isomerase [Wenxinia saemankumensis]SHI52541.1 2-hydroxychromene-2-carboxylate isomerase [Wenxinia saemankumensis]
MGRIDYYCSPLSPYTYLAGGRPEEIAARHGHSLSYKPLDVIALFSRTGGTAPKDRHPSRQEYRAQELRRQAVKADMTLNLRPAHWPTNGAPACYAIIAAQEDGSGDTGMLLQSLALACWAEEKDIARDEVIRAALEGAGFDPGLADRGLMTGAEVYARNLEDAVNAGVFGLPFWVTETDERFWGQDRLDDLDAHLAGRL